jgi:hypothetical protein
MSPPIKAGLLYFAIVFIAGFVLGTVRVLVVVPVLGEFKAVALELPVILFASWLACHKLIVTFSVPPEATPRIVMGALAFGILMLVEFGFSVLVLGRSGPEYFALLRTTPGLLGLAGQLGFALMPLLLLKKSI